MTAALLTHLRAQVASIDAQIAAVDAQKSALQQQRLEALAMITVAEQGPGQSIPQVMSLADACEYMHKHHGWPKNRLRAMRKRDQYPSAIRRNRGMVWVDINELLLCLSGRGVA